MKHLRRLVFSTVELHHRRFPRPPVKAVKATSETRLKRRQYADRPVEKVLWTKWRPDSTMSRQFQQQQQWLSLFCLRIWPPRSCQITQRPRTKCPSSAHKLLNRRLELVNKCFSTVTCKSIIELTPTWNKVTWRNSNISIGQICANRKAVSAQAHTP